MKWRYVDLLPVDVRAAIDVTVNGKRMGGQLSVRFPAGEKLIIKVGQDETVFKMYQMNKSCWVYTTTVVGLSTLIAGGGRALGNVDWRAGGQFYRSAATTQRGTG